jgi:hypothetical protein
VRAKQEFNPEKYQTFLQIACNVYHETGSPVKMMEPFLKVMLRGVADYGALGKFDESKFDYKRAYLASPLR